MVDAPAKKKASKETAGAKDAKAEKPLKGA
jgi:hypothetical protein